MKGAPMRVTLVHNFYQQAGGEDQVVANEQALLSARGHEVALHTATNDGIQGSWAKLKTAWDAPYSRHERVRFAQALAKGRPDVVHVHNFFPLLTPALFDACRDAGVPVVLTLHNYRLVCPGALLMREGRICEECLTRSPYRSVLHRCYRGSALGTLATARMVSHHRHAGTWQDRVDRFIALTAFAKSRFVAAGFPAAKIAVKPNGYEERSQTSPELARRGGLFVGRLSPEKGIATLLEAWHSLDVDLRILGDGPMQEAVRGAAPCVSYLGRRGAAEVSLEMAQAAFLVAPSEWYEGFPMVLVEAFAHGLPVIASRLGSLAEIVQDGVTGLLFTPGRPDDLAAKVRWAADHPEELRRMGANARREYEAKYTPETNYRQLMDIYAQAKEQALL